MVNDAVLVLKDEENQQAVPSVWRSAFVDIVEALKDGDYQLTRGVAGVQSVSAEDAAMIAGAIKDYGATLNSLPEETWKTSVCQWMWGYWDVLVDLFTVEEGASDLVLFIRVFENDSLYTFKVQSVHVP